MRMAERSSKFALLILLLCAPAGVASQSPSGHQPNSPTVRVLVLDALDGKPQAEVRVTYLCDEIPHSYTYQVTDMTGLALVPFTCSAGKSIELDTVPQNRKEGCGGGVVATLEEIQSTGIIGKPDSAGGIWCPTKISRKLTAVPGQVTLFVKKPTWWQSHIAG
jgi:hypothetical protein